MGSFNFGFLGSSNQRCIGAQETRTAINPVPFPCTANKRHPYGYLMAFRLQPFERLIRLARTRSM
jgi:hypothetical protein